MSKSKNNEWMNRHVSDNFVKKAQNDGYRSRAAYKLLELDEKDKLFKPGMCIVDLGAAPGGWCQVASRLVGDNGRIIALDLLAMDSFEHVEFIQGDFTEESIYKQLMDTLSGQPVDLVICDLAPNLSGVRLVDQSKAMYLVELALDFAQQVLKPGGNFAVKVFEGEGLDEFRQTARGVFSKVLNRKPKASRDESRELYIVGKGKR